MDFGNLKKSMEKIKMSEEMQNRMIRNCRFAAIDEMEENTMKKRVSLKKPYPLLQLLCFASAFLWLPLPQPTPVYSRTSAAGTAL